ncbi:hypothetical protein Hanom_Chr03g00219401 [Helianthus anomalus]
MMLSEFFDLKSCSVSGVTFKATCKTTGDNAFHTDVFPASCAKTGLPDKENYILDI